MLFCFSKTFRLIVGAAALCTAFSAQAASITALDVIPRVISGDGSTIAGFGRVSGELGIQVNGNTQFLQEPNIARSQLPFGISRDGSQILVDVSGSGRYLLSNTGVFTEFSTIAGAENFTPSAISGDGNTFAGRNSLDQAAVFNNGEIRVLNSSNASSSAIDISADGRTVVGGVGGNAVIWRDGIETSFGFGDSAFAFGTAVSADGSTVVGADFDRGSTFVYRNETRTLLQTPEGEDHSGVIRALSVSGDGKIIIDPLSAGTSFIWELNEDGNYVASTLADRLLQLGLDISAEGWGGLLAFDISEDGRFIVGQGFQTDNPITGFLIDLHPVPLPTAAWLFASAFIGLIASKKLRQSR